MTDHTDHNDDTHIGPAHVPTPAFRAKLEREVVEAFRRESRLAPASRWRATGWLRTAAAIAFGAFLASGTGFAAAQVTDARQRSELSEALVARLQLATLRLEMAEARMNQARERGAVGVATRDELVAAEAELRAMKAAVEKLQLELVEIRATSVSPRDELWAPLVDGRDFVTQRMAVELNAVQQAVAMQERIAHEVESQFRVGAVPQTAVMQARLEALAARRELDLLGTKLALRREFLQEKLSAELIARRLQQFEIVSEMALVEERMRIARERLAVASARAAIGAGEELDRLRADVQLQELQLALKALQMQIAALEAATRR